MSHYLRAEFQSKQNRKPTGFTVLQSGALCLVCGQLLRRNGGYQFSGRATYVTLEASLVTYPNTKEVTMDNVDHIILVLYTSVLSIYQYDILEKI
jgi:hypothetical protein